MAAKKDETPAVDVAALQAELDALKSENAALKIKADAPAPRVRLHPVDSKRVDKLAKYQAGLDAALADDNKGLAAFYQRRMAELEAKHG